MGVVCSLRMFFRDCSVKDPLQTQKEDGSTTSSGVSWTRSGFRRISPQADMSSHSDGTRRELLKYGILAPISRLYKKERESLAPCLRTCPGIYFLNYGHTDVLKKIITS